MSTLYEIDRNILECIDDETGEILDAEKLEQLQIERDAKIEGVACWVKDLKAEADAIKAERASLDERERSARRKVESLETWLTNALDGQKFSTSKCDIRWRKSKSVNITDENELPEAYIKIKVEKSPDKAAIADTIKHGIAVPGARLVENKNISIK